jgi:hypothetical protein
LYRPVSMRLIKNPRAAGVQPIGKAAGGLKFIWEI